MRNRLKRLKRPAQIILLVFVAVVVLPVVIPLVRVAVECRMFGGGKPVETANPAGAEPITAGLSGYARLEDQTYLTLPEWYIVYSLDEYAAFIAQNPPSRFPYFGAVGQFWQSYSDVCAVTRDRYSFNSSYHLSLVVIGASFTVENVLKGIYENTVGRVTEWISSSDLTEEDVYAREVAKEYGEFVHTIPWYEFPFGEKLRELWGSTHGWGPNVIRKWERKTVLSVEYGLKALYGWLIRQGARAVYAPEDLEIQVWAAGVSEAALKQEPDVRVVRAFDGEAAIVSIPRYEAFTQIVPRLAKQGVRFVEMAGNDEILVTAFAPRDWQYDLPNGEFLFAMPILTQPELKRVAVRVPVRSLPLVLEEMENSGVKLEHIYDY